MPDEQAPPPLTLSHETLLVLADQLGYQKVNEQGLCYGYQAMGKQAAFIEDLASFKKRLNFISKELAKLGSVDKLVESLQIQHEANLQLRLQLRKDLLKQLNEKTPISDENFSQLLKDKQETPEVQQYQNALANIIDPIIDLEAFFGLLLIHFGPQDFPELFEPNSNLHQNTQTSYIRTLPDTMLKISSDNEATAEDRLALQQEKHAVKEIGVVTAMYRLQEMIELFNCFKENGVPPAPIAMEINSINHSISLVYNTQEQCWDLIDANLFPEIKSFTMQSDALDFAIALSSAFPFTDNDNQFRALTLKLSCTENNLNEAETWSTNLKNNPKWTKIYAKQESIDINRLDSYGVSLLMKAAQENDLEGINRLLNSKNLNINQPSSTGKTALHYAIARENEQVVDILLRNGADASIFTQPFLTYLAQNSSLQRQKIVNLINEFKAFDYNFKQCVSSMERKNINDIITEPILNNIKEQVRSGMPYKDLMLQLEQLESSLDVVQNKQSSCTVLLFKIVLAEEKNQENLIFKSKKIATSQMQKWEGVLNSGNTMEELIDNLSVFEKELQEQLDKLEQPKNDVTEFIEKNSSEQSYIKPHYIDKFSNIKTEFNKIQKNNEDEPSDDFDSKLG